VKQRVLIIESSLTIRMDLAESFEESGFETTACESLDCARESLRRSSPHVLILDLHLPDGDGIDFLSELRESPTTADVGIILLSAREEAEELLRGVSIGADEYVAKPYDTVELLERAELLARRERGATVLVIDDSLTYRERLREILETAGYGVITAENGEDGLHLASVRRPTAIIVDYMLPGIQGDAVIRRIRQEGRLRRTPTLLLTASDDPYDQLRALEAGADTFVRKDQDPDVLLACLNSIVRAASTPSALVDSATEDRPRVIVVSTQGLFALLESEIDSRDMELIVVPNSELLATLTAGNVDCVVLDARGSDSQAVQSEIQGVKRNSELGGTRVVVIGESDERQLMIAFMNIGADDYVGAISGVQVIAARVRAHLRRKRLEDENRNLREHLLRNQLAAETQKELARTAAIRNEELQQLAETIPALVWTCSPDGQLTYSNSRWQDYTGIHAEQTLGDGWFQVLHPEDRSRTVNAFRGAIDSGSLFQAEYRMRSADGAYRWFLGRALPVRSQGKVARWFGTAIDIEEGRRAEEALRRSEKIAATGRLAASIAHEINNPLESVTNILYLLPGAIRQDPELAASYVDIAQQEIARVSHITRQTLAFYRDTGKAEEIEICPLVNEVIRMYSSKAREAKVTIEMQLECGERIVGFTGEVRQVIGNLVANAIEASPAGAKVAIRVCLWWNWQTGQSGVRVAVHDSGRGIPPGFAAQLFKPFATTKGQKGTGLGLWVSQSIVEKHGGSIRFRSSVKPGCSGTCFAVFLPSAPHEPNSHEDEVRRVFGHVGRELLNPAKRM